jgi:predicted transcriptional regulator
MKQLGKTLIGLDAVNVFHTGTKIPEDAEKLPSDFIISPVNPEAELIITNFVKKDTQQKYIMVVNKSTNNKEVVRMNIDTKISGIKEISSVSGKLKSVLVNQTDHILELNLLPGEGKLYRIDN